MKSGGLARLAATCQLLLAASAANTPPANSIWGSSDFKRATYLSSAVVRDHLYLDGGEVALSSGYFLGSTLKINLAQDWTNTTVIARQIDKPLHFRYARFALLWSDGSNLYTYGGIPYYFHGCTDQCFESVWEVATSTVASTDYTKLRNSLRDLPATLYKLPLEGFGSSAWAGVDAKYQPPELIGQGQGCIPTVYDDKMYAFGGFAGLPYADSPHNSLSSTSGIASWNLNATGWQNQTSSSFEPAGSAAMGVGVAAPFGSQGVIIYIGGYAPSKSKGYFFGTAQAPTKSLAQIGIYDISTGKFMSQTATGDIPDNRWSFCAVGASDKNSSTFDIFIHGGFNTIRMGAPVVPSLEKTYVLSLPEFIWTEIPDSKQAMRSSPTCQLIGRSQMLIVGGGNPADNVVGGTPDPWANGIGIFDLNRWKWASSYNSSAPEYKRADPLVTLYKTKRYPRTWNSTEVKRLFKTTAWQYPDRANASDIGAIAGGVIGGVVGLALILAAFFTWRWKRRSVQRQSRLLDAAEVEAVSKPEPVELPQGPQPSELPEDRKFVELDSPPLCELEPSEEAGSTPGSQETDADHDGESAPQNRYEMEG